MCKYGIKTENARFGMRAAIAKRFSGDAAPERLRFFRISVGFSCGACACLGARERSERVTGRRQPPRQLCRADLYQDKHTPCCHTRNFSVNKGYIRGYKMTRSYSKFQCLSASHIGLSLQLRPNRALHRRSEDLPGLSSIRCVG